MSLISLKDVTKIYPKGSRPALDKINLNINRGDFVFLVGASGSGKTTLLRLLLREEEATEGEIRVAGTDLRRLRDSEIPGYRRSIGFVFQDYKLLTNKTVWQNVAFTLEVIGARRSTIKTLVPQVLKTVGLTGKEGNYPHELSGGEAQRVALARAYVNHPQILLADEPTGNLDPTTSLGIMEVLDAINRTGTTVVMATHNEEIVNSMRKRVVELHTGQIVRDQAHGSYDSSRFFPDAEVEARAYHAISNPTDGDSLDQAGQAGGSRPGVKVTSVPSLDKAPISDGTRGAIEVVEAAAQAVHDSQYGDEGIARLASSVHSGRTGRYGQVFTQVEDTLTWGRGIMALEKDGQGKTQVQGEDGQELTEVTAQKDQSEPSPSGSDSDTSGGQLAAPVLSQEEAKRGGSDPAQSGNPSQGSEYDQNPPVSAGQSLPSVQVSQAQSDGETFQGPPSPPSPPQQKGRAGENVHEEDGQ